MDEVSTSKAYNGSVSVEIPRFPSAPTRGSTGSIRPHQTRNAARFFIGLGVIVVLMGLTWLLYSMDARLRDSLTATEARIATLQDKLAALEATAPDAKNRVAKLESVIDMRVAEAHDRARADLSKSDRITHEKLNQHSKAIDDLEHQVKSNFSQVHDEVKSVKAQVRSVESSLQKVRDKLVQPPTTLPPQQIQDNYFPVAPDQMQLPKPISPVQGGGAAAGGTKPSGQRRDPSAPKLSREFDDIEDKEERNTKRREKIRSEFDFAYSAYKKYAWGRDELRPVTMTYKDWVRSSKGIGLTIFDSLTTMILMNMTLDVNTAIDYILEHVNFNQNMRISAFEATIRIVAGLLSVFELTGEKDRRLVDLAAKVMDKLLFAYNTSSGVPHSQVNLMTHKHWSPDWTSGGAVLSEFASIQLELRTLSYHTKNPLYDMRATHMMDAVESHCKQQEYLCPTFMDPQTGMFRDDHITFGALGDSYYEYLVKQYLLTGRTEQRYKEMAVTALKAASRRLIRYSEPSRQAFIAEFNENTLDFKMDELSCFTGGMFALAAMEIPDNGAPLEFRRIAEELTTTCYQMWAYQNSGLAPESVNFIEMGDFSNGPTQYMLRPETLESLFYVWRLTKNETYREWAWDIFTAIHTYCRVASGGYTGIVSIDILPPEPDDVMQSFFLAETMKYLYLIFSDDSLLPLHEWVLNTEAHPLKIRKRDPLDVWTAWEDAHGGTLPWEAPTLEGVSVVTETKRMAAYRRAHPGRIVVAPADPLAEEEPDPDEEIAALEAAGQRVVQPSAEPWPGLKRPSARVAPDHQQRSRRVSADVKDPDGDLGDHTPVQPTTAITPPAAIPDAVLGAAEATDAPQPIANSDTSATTDAVTPRAETDGVVADA